MGVRSPQAAGRFEDAAFVAVLVSVIILIAVAGVDPLAVKVVTDLMAAYWTARIANTRAGATGTPGVATGTSV